MSLFITEELGRCRVVPWSHAHAAGTLPSRDVALNGTGQGIALATSYRYLDQDSGAKTEPPGDRAWAGSMPAAAGPCRSCRNDGYASRARQSKVGASRNKASQSGVMGGLTSFGV